MFELGYGLAFTGCAYTCLSAIGISEQPFTLVVVRGFSREKDFLWRAL